MMAPAMDRDDEKFLLLVNRAVVEAADSVALVPMLRKNAEKKAAAQQRNEEGGMTNEESGERRAEGGEFNGLDVSESPSLPVSESAFDEDRFRAVLGKLMERREAVMQDALWKPLVPLARACAARVLPMEVVQRIDALLVQDESQNRRGLRHVLCWKWAMASHASQEPVMGEVEEVLGLRKVEPEA